MFIHLLSRVEELYGLRNKISLIFVLESAKLQIYLLIYTKKQQNYVQWAVLSLKPISSKQPLIADY